MGVDDQLLCVCARFARSQADGGCTGVRDPETVSPIPGHIRSHIQSNLRAAGKSRGRGDLATQRGRIVKNNGGFTPGVIGHREGVNTQVAGAVGMDHQANSHDGAGHTGYGEADITVYSRRAIHSYGDASPVIYSRVGGIHIRIGNRSEGERLASR